MLIHRLLLAAVTWPKFSMTAYRMVCRLKAQGLHPRTVLDIGANVGQFAVTATKLWSDCHVESFEPIPDCAETLRSNCRNLSVKVHEVAVGNRDGNVPIHINSHRQSSSILTLGATHREAFPFARDEGTRIVRLVRLDTLFKKGQLGRPVLLKLDVQGYEPEALRGAAGILGDIDYVLMETSFRPLYEGEQTFSEMLLLMESFGFQFLRPVDWLEDRRTGEVMQMDALFAGPGKGE
jgi:FkbM family methyltransferase